MKTVTQQFINEQLKSPSAGVRWKIMARSWNISTQDYDLLDLTPYLSRDSLSRVEWRMENQLTEFAPSDFQFSLVYDETIWTWLQEHDPIIVEVDCGFDFEKVRVFWGYLDKDNLRKDSLGVIYIRIMSLLEYLNATKTSEVFGPVLNMYRPLRDSIKLIFDYLELSNQTIKILPFDTYPNAENYVLSYFGLEPYITTVPEEVCRIDDHKFYFIHYGFLWLGEFNDDYSDFTVTFIESPASPDLYFVKVDKWADDKFGIIVAEKRNLRFRYTASSYVWIQVYTATQIRFFDDSGNLTSSQAITTYTSGLLYYPMALSIKPIINENAYVVMYNGTSSSVVINCAVKIFDATNHAQLFTTSWVSGNNLYFHQYNSEATSGRYAEWGLNYYITILTNGSHPEYDVNLLRIRKSGGVWQTTLFQTAYGFDILRGSMQTLGPWVLFKDTTYAYNAYSNSWWSNFWTNAANALGKTVIQSYISNPHQLVTGYNTANDTIEIKTWTPNVGIATTTIVDLLPTDYSAKTGFTYWRTYADKPCLLAIIIDPEGKSNVGVIANQIYPFVLKPPLSDNETLSQTLQDLALAGCCVVSFPDDDTGKFISRMFWDETAIYAVDPRLFDKQWNVTYQEPRRVIVQSGEMEVEVGEGHRSITISCDYIPDYDDEIGQAYAYQYYNFYTNYPYVIEIDTDFLLQFDLFDLVEMKDHAQTEIYQGRIMRTVQENARVNFEIRGKKI